MTASSKKGWINRSDFPMPYQNVSPFPKNAIVQVKNTYGESLISVAKDLWWGYETFNEEGTITIARRLDRPKKEKY